VTVNFTSNDVRVRRPKAHEALLLQLKEEGGFQFMRDSLLFAAGLGHHESRRIAFEESGEAIRYETLIEPAHASTLISLLAVAEHPDDPEILDGARLAERIRIFEEYANGGLTYLQEEINTRGLPLQALLLAIVADALSSETAERPEAPDLMSGL
jgi:dnd system-associated protein 4